MQKAIACGFSPKRLIFSGVAKDREELEAALSQGIFQINVESFEELKLLGEIDATNGSGVISLHLMWTLLSIG